jgi:PST family polysaccharide transporter
VIAWSALTVVIGGAALQHGALLTRAMRFRELALIEVSSAVVGLSVSITCALWLRSYWALWLGTFGSAVVQTGLMWVFQKWTPSRGIVWTGMSHILKFGGGVTGFNLVNYAVRNADSILIARFSGANALGLYDQSYKLMMAPMLAINGPLGRVMMPVLSRLTDQAERYRTAYLSVVTLLMFALTPGLAVVAAKSAIVVPFLLGEQWAAAAPIFFWLSLTGLVQPFANTTFWLFLSSGRTGAMFWWGVVSSVVTMIGFGIGIRWGAEGIAAALFWTMLLRMPPLFIWCVRGTPVSAADMFRITVEPVATTAIVFFFVVPLFSGLEPFWSLAASAALAYVVAAALALATPSGRRLWSRILAQSLRTLSSIRPVRTG